jgi:hypothetical protein
MIVNGTKGPVPGSFEGRFPRHFVPGYDRCCPYGTRWQTLRNSSTKYNYSEIQ